MKGKSGKKSDRAKSMLKKCGYSSGGALSGAAPSDMKKKADGGPIPGKASSPRLDKKSRSKGSGKTQVNIIIAGKDQDPSAGMPPMLPPPTPPAVMPPKPMIPPSARAPIGGPAAGATPPGIMNRGGRAYASGGSVKDEEYDTGEHDQEPMGKKHGGSVKSKGYPITAAAGGGKGRLEKAAAQKPRNKSGPKKTK